MSPHTSLGVMLPPRKADLAPQQYSFFFTANLNREHYTPDVCSTSARQSHTATHRKGLPSLNIMPRTSHNNVFEMHVAQLEKHLRVQHRLGTSSVHHAMQGSTPVTLHGMGCAGRSESETLDGLTIGSYASACIHP